MGIFKPVNTDNRGYTNCYECKECKALIYTAEYSKECEFNYCPYCAAPDKED